MILICKSRKECLLSFCAVNIEITLIAILVSHSFQNDDSSILVISAQVELYDFRNPTINAMTLKCWVSYHPAQSSLSALLSMSRDLAQGKRIKIIKISIGYPVA